MDDVDDVVAARRRAMEQVGELLTAAQTGAAWVDDALAAAITGAREWPEVLVPLLRVEIVRAQQAGRDPLPLVDRLQAEASRHGMRAMEASARALRLDIGAADGLGGTSFDLLAETRVLLEDTAQPAQHRYAGFSDLWETLLHLGLYRHADEALAAAAEIVALLDDPERARAVIAANRALAALYECLDAVVAGLGDVGAAALARFDRIRASRGWATVPGGWSRELAAFRRAAELAAADEALDPVESAALVAELDDRAANEEIRLLLRLLTPADTWDGTPDVAHPHRASSTVGHFLLARALARQEGGTSPAAAAHREHARVLAVQVWRDRDAASDALTAKIEAHRLVEEHRALREQVMTDPLTGIRNRRAFATVMARLEATPVTVLTVDLDRFKAVNDLHGHAVGDEVLQRTAGALADAVGLDADGTAEAADGPAVLARVGGDEFVAVLEGADEVRARRLRTAITAAVGGLDWSDLLGDAAQHVSVGVACGPCGPELLRAADVEMYGEKSRDQARLSG